MNFWDNDITTDSRPYVMELQSYLRALQRAQTGATTMPQDGFYDTSTAAGVRQFQTAAGLPTSGEVDLATWEALFAAYQDLQDAQAPPLLIRGLRTLPLRLKQHGESGKKVAA